MLTSEWVYSRARNPELRIGIGADPRDEEKVRRSARLAQDMGLCTPMIFTEPHALVESLYRGQIQAAIRGDLASNETMKAVRSRFGLDRVLRAALLQPQGGSMFFLAPVGVDEGWTVEEKLELIRLTSKLLERMEVDLDAAVLSGGRSGDMGRHSVVDRTIKDAEEVVRIARKEGFRVKHFEILIESAAPQCNLIIAPDGISGNLIFRTLHFLGRGEALGAPILNLDQVFVDTSRAKTDYTDSFALASALAKGRKI